MSEKFRSEMPEGEVEYTPEDVKRLEEKEMWEWRKAQNVVEQASKELKVSIQGEWEEVSQQDAQIAPEVFARYRELWTVPSGASGLSEGFAYAKDGKFQKTDRTWDVRASSTTRGVFGGGRGDIDVYAPRTEWSPSEIKAALDVEKLSAELLEARAVAKDAHSKSWGIEDPTERKDAIMRWEQAEEKAGELLIKLREAGARLETERSTRRRAVWIHETE